MNQKNIRGIRSINSLMGEDAVLTAGIYGVFIAYCMERLPFLALQALMIIYVIRVFNLRHERSHLPLKNLPTWKARISELLEVYHTPYQEPFSEKRRKHIHHHRAHAGHSAKAMAENAHGYLDSSLVGGFLSAIFYHELMCVLDLARERGLSPERIRSLIVASGMIGLTILLAGPENFLAFFLAYRLSSFIAWFSFSYLLHTDSLYATELGHRLPHGFKRGFEQVFGQGSVTAIFHHQFHHRRPAQFYKF